MDDKGTFDILSILLKMEKGASEQPFFSVTEILTMGICSSVIKELRPLTGRTFVTIFHPKALPVFYPLLCEKMSSGTRNGSLIY